MVDLAGNIFILNNIDQGPCDLHDSVVISGVVTDTQLLSCTLPDTIVLSTTMSLPVHGE